MSNFQTIDPSALATACGGQAARPQQDDEAPRTWGQVGREYAAACIQGAGQSLIFAGKPKNAREGMKNAALGCAMGVGMKAIDDGTQMLSQ